MTLSARLTLWVLFVAWIALSAILYGCSPPEGWFAFEFPAWFDVDPASWTAAERKAVFFGLGLDFLFIFVYASFVTVLARAIAGRIPAVNVCRNCIPMLALWIWVSAAADALENWGLHCWLREGEGWLLTISILATIKWVLIVLMAILLVVGLFQMEKKKGRA